MNIQATGAYEAWGYPGVVLVGVGILVVTAVASYALVRLVRKLLHLTTDGAVGGSILANIIRAVVWVLGVSAILQQCFDFNPSVVWGALGVGGIAISLGLQSTISNLIGGLQLSLSREVSVGDWVIIGGGVPSRVLDINWRVTKLEDEFGNVSIVPNQVLNSTTVIVQPEPYALSFPLALVPSIDVEEARENITRIAHDALSEAGMAYGDRAPVLSVTGTTVDSIASVLKVYALRDFNQVQVNNVVMPPVLKYLEGIGGLAHCYSG